jgi:DNA-binding NarL/FixJ family response regulator
VNSNPIRVSIVEDNTAELRAFGELVDRSAGLQCVSLHPSLDHARRTLPEHRPDVVLLDLRFDGEVFAYEALPGLKSALPQTQFLLLTRFDDDEAIFESLRAGASGYWLKSEPLDQLADVIIDAKNGKAPMSSVVARKVLAHFRGQAANAVTVARVSPRERQILECLAAGKRYADIATELGISYDTVRAHLRKIYEKLHVHSRGEAVAKYFRRGA